MILQVFIYIYDKGEQEQKYDCSYAQYVYDEEGVERLIEEYLYDEERFTVFKTPDDFINDLQVTGVTSEDMEILDKSFKENLVPMLDKKQTLANIAELLQSLQHLEMNGLAAKVEHIHTVLSKEWENDLVEDGKDETVLSE